MARLLYADGYRLLVSEQQDPEALTRGRRPWLLIRSRGVDGARTKTEFGDVRGSHVLPHLGERGTLAARVGEALDAACDVAFSKLPLVDRIRSAVRRIFAGP